MEMGFSKTLIILEGLNLCYTPWRGRDKALERDFDLVRTLENELAKGKGGGKGAENNPEFGTVGKKDRRYIVYKQYVNSILEDDFKPDTQYNSVSILQELKW